MKELILKITIKIINFYFNKILPLPPALFDLQEIGRDHFVLEALEL